MANTYVLYEGDGATATYTVPFEYLQTSHVQVLLNEVLQATPADYVWASASSITFGTTPADGAAIRIKRVTPGDTRLVNYTNGANLVEADLNLDSNQIFYLAQETKENLTELINNEILRIGAGTGVVSTDPDTVVAGIVSNILNDEAATAIQARITDIDTNAEAIINNLGLINDNFTSIGSLQTIVSELAGSIAAEVYVQTTAPVPGVGGVPDPIGDNARWYDSDDNNHPYIYISSAWVDLEDPRIGANESAITALEATVNDGSTGVAATAAALAVLDATVVTNAGVVTALAADVTTLTATVGSNTSAISTESGVRASADSALAGTISLIGAENGGGTAFILDTSTVKIDTDGGDTFATRLTALGAADASNLALISTINSVSLPDLQARYGVTLNVNGYITGFLQNNDGTTGTFDILTDKFRVVDPASGGQNPTFVFSIESGSVLAQNMKLGTLQLGASGSISIGKTSASDTTNGLWVGYDGTSGYDIHVGDADQFMWWDASAGSLKVNGNLQAGYGVSKASYTERTSTTTYAADPDLTLDLDVGTHIVEGILVGYTQSAAPGMKIRLTFDGTDTVGATEFRLHNETYTSINYLSYGGGGGPLNQVVLDEGVIGHSPYGAAYITFRLLLNVTVAGTFEVEWAQQTSSTAWTRMLADSWIKSTRING